MNYGKLDSLGLNLKSSTFVDILTQHAARNGDNAIFTFITDSDNKRESITYAELDYQARKIASFLQSRNLKGKRALLLYPPGLQYIAGFFGCLYAGVIAVPAYPPSPAALERSLPRLETISKDAEASLALTTEKIMSLMQIYFRHSSEATQLNKTIRRWNESDAAANISNLFWVATDSREVMESEEYKDERIAPDSIAFLQYTSGSTGSPKGVMVSHRNLVHNSVLIKEGFRISPEENEAVIWLPFYHDMGLIGGILQPIFSGLQTTLMSPITFLSWPQKWLQIISSIKNKNVISGGPNFAYELCLRKLSVEQIESLDLRNWTVAFTGAEPVRAETLDNFSQTFQPAGFRKEAFYPCYGMAETTLFVTGKNFPGLPVIEVYDKKSMQGKIPGKSIDTSSTGLKLVGCGRVIGDQKIIIVNPEDKTVCANGEIGEIWVAGASVAQGYWRKGEETEYTFFAFTSDTNEGPFLRTGDLGFMDENQELFVTGRLKDLIIIRGKNFYPQDIENTAEKSHPILRASCVAAFSIEEEREERLVIVQEIQSGAGDLEEAIMKIREAVSEEHDIQVYSVVLIKAKTISKTSSGKIQRQAVKNQYLSGTLNIIKETRLSQNMAEGEQVTENEVLDLTSNIKNDPDISKIDKWLLYVLASILKVNVKSISPGRSIASFGMDSLMMVELKNDIESKLGISISISELFQNSNSSSLANRIFEQLANGNNNNSLPVIPVLKYRNEGPLSYGQKSLWFMQQLEPNNTAYNIFFAARIQSELDVHALRKSFDLLIDRHASLRTTYHNGENGPYQKIQIKSRSYMSEINAVEWKESRINEKIIAEAHRPFDLTQGPIFRVTLLKISEHEHILLMNFHHIAVDLWSIVILLSELRQLYPAIKKGEKADLEFSDLQYSDFVNWQAKYLEAADGRKSYDYWRHQLAGEIPVLNLPNDKTRPQIKTYNGAVFSFQINNKITNRLKTIVRDENSTLYIVLLAVFNILMNRYSHQEEIIIGSPASGRDRPELENIVGYFVNTMVIRSKVQDNILFRDYLANLRKTVLDALDHQGYPFSLLVEKLQHHRGASRSPFFDVMFVLERPHLLKELGLAGFILSDSGAKLNLGGLRLESYHIEHKVAQFDLTLSIVEKADSLSATLQYNTDLFDAGTIKQMADHFKTLLENVSSNPERKIRDYSPIPLNEMKTLMNQLNSTAGDFRKNNFIHEQFENQVLLTPNAIAIISEGQQVSYAQLNRMANRIAFLLKSNGIRKEDSVGIFSKRSAKMIAGILGIFKSGGTYVPLDPEYPEERINFMRNDAGVSIVLTTREFESSLEKSGIKVILLEESINDTLQSENPQLSIEAESTAYIIYTSGSTGKPKGVMVPHTALGNHCRKIKDYYKIEDKDRVLQFSSMNFDASLEQVFVTLISGAALILREEELWSAEVFLNKISQMGLTVINLPPSYWEQLISEWSRFKNPDFHQLRLIIIGGDVIHYYMLKKWFSLEADQVKLINAYGPTETTITSVTGELKEEHLKGGERNLPIGKPQANRTAYILDENGEIVPRGVIGELYIGGDCLASGYKGLADLTAERFVPDPFNKKEGQRLYRTGDLVRYLTDGNLEFIGRVDHQVKIRGFRVELGEIESVLRMHPAVKNAVTVLNQNSLGDKSIIVYVVLQNKCEIFELKNYLSQKLPGFLIPSSVIIMDSFPMTPAGKIDR
ncbi:MAG: amino acid adenylation domain-containing protein, partial [Ignavibacteriales bacterium]